MTGTTSVEYVCDRNGIVVKPKFHDARLTGIELHSEHDVRLSIQASARDRYIVALLGVRRLRADEFREGNIILDVTIERGADCDPDLLAELYDLRDGNPYVATLLSEVRTNNLALAQLNPSYGCRLLALCKDVTIASSKT
jgi:hypothetical protein